MGASSFTHHITVSKEMPDSEAFNTARSDAAHEHGHGGYTGTLAEKSSFIMLYRARSRRNAERIMNTIMDHSEMAPPLYRDEITAAADDKWGPALAVRYPASDRMDGILFFGFASS